MTRLHFSILLMALNAACGSQPSLKRFAQSHPEAGEITYYKDTKPLIEEKCVGCHTPGGLAPFSLVELADIKAHQRGIRRSVLDHSMPPWIADRGHQVYRDDLSLSDGEIATLVKWLDDGLVAGDPKDYKAPPRKRFDADRTVALFTDGESYEPDQGNSDEYRCFLVKNPRNQEFLTGFNAVPGNSRIVHHLVAFAADSTIAPILEGLDAEEPGKGYRCFGGALPDRLSDEAVRKRWEAKYPDLINLLHDHHYWLAHWAPGMDGGYIFPEGTGVKLPSSGLFVVQMHYYTADAKGESDSTTRMELKVASEVAKPAFYYPLTNSRWLVPGPLNDMVIPPNTTKTYAASAKLSQVLDHGRKILDLPPNLSIKNMEVHSANLHMHSIGSSGAVALKNPSGHSETLLSISEWDLHWQRDFAFEEPKVIPASELASWTNTVSCTFYNFKSITVRGGFGSMDEMCFNFGFFAFDLER